MPYHESRFDCDSHDCRRCRCAPCDRAAAGLQDRQARRGRQNLRRPVLQTHRHPPPPPPPPPPATPPPPAPLGVAAPWLIGVPPLFCFGPPPICSIRAR